MRHRVHRGVLGAALVLVTVTAACHDAGTSPLVPAATTRRAGDAIVDLNPQPEPPSLSLHYVLSPDGSDWFGMVYVGDQACGSMQLLQTSSRQTGIVTHLAYSLSIQGANPDFQMDADLSGVLVRGRVVLNGKVRNGTYAGRTIHPQGRIVAAPEDGSVDLLTRMLGAIELNPQPEPPSASYPPSPCITG